SSAELEAAARLAVGDAGAAHRDADLAKIALSAPGRASDNLRELALLLERTNRIESLRSLLFDAEASGIAREELGYVAAAMALRDGDATEASRILKADPFADPVRAHRLKSRIAEALGDPDTAFAEAEAMNASVHDFDEWRLEGARYREGLRKLASAIATFPVQPVVEPAKRPSPAFLLGFPRSGTTLADTFLMGHPSIRVVEEEPMLGAAEDVLGGIERLPRSSPETLRQARDAYFRLLDEAVGGPFEGVVIDKLPLNMTRLHLIHALFPDARIIFAQRHPCDAVLSCFMQGFALNAAMASFLDISDAADLYDCAMELFLKSREALPLRTETLVYEALIEDPESALRPVIEFLELEWRPELLDHRATALRRGAINTPSYDQVSEKLSAAPSGRWHRYRNQLAPVLEVLLPWAERLGYRQP
ncbi:MAG TPA: sulfotransferase, partial [Sphingomicrobium sp.]|nr:sulfotransferase [Sphingomicrobium sp.]